MEHSEQRDVIAVLTADHREFEQLFSDLETTKDPERRHLIAEHVIADLVRHSVAEEQYLYPAVRGHVAGGDEIADHETEEHAEAERTMKQIEQTETGSQEFDQLVSQLIAEIRHHLDEEETKLFPKLAAACSVAELRELGAKVEWAKKLAPTRPHPSAPDHPPLNKILGPGIGLVDRVRDTLTGRNS